MTKLLIDREWLKASLTFAQQGAYRSVLAHATHAVTVEDAAEAVRDDFGTPPDCISDRDLEFWYGEMFALDTVLAKAHDLETASEHQTGDRETSRH